jgi:hypothetical protein
MIEFVLVGLKVSLELLINILLLSVQLLFKFDDNIADFLLNLELQSVQVVLDRLEVLQFLLLPIEKGLILFLGEY